MPDLNLIGQLWYVAKQEMDIMIVLLIKLPQLCDAIMLICAKTFEEHFQHLVESIPQRIIAVLKAKIDPMW